MDVRRTLLLGIAASGGGGIAYQLRDLFTTDRAAGSVDGTASEPGPGTREVTADSASALSIANDEIAVSAAASDTDPALYWTDNTGNGLMRQAGLCLAWYARNTGITDPGWIGWSNSITLAADTMVHGIKGRAPYYGAAPGTNYAISRGDLRYVLLLHATGAKLFYKLGNSYYLGGIFTTGADGTLWPALLGAAGYYADVRVFRVGASLWADPYSLCTSHVAGAVSAGQAFTHDPQFILKIKFVDTGTGSSATLVRFAIQDATNYWYLSVAASTIQLRVVIDGTGTLKGQVTTSIYDGNILTITRRVDGQQGWTFTVAVNGVSKITRVSETAFVTQTDGLVYQLGAVGAAIADLEIYPLSLSTQPPFDPFLTGNNAFGVMGDSKSDNEAWRDMLIVALERETLQNWTMTFTNAVAGRTVATAKAAIDAAIAAFSGVIPSVVLSNFGANDAASMPLEADYKANYLYMLDALYTAFGCQVYIADSWRRGEAVDCATLAAWNAAIVAERAFAHKGHDEQVWLEGGDDGVTYTGDGVHYNENGNIECARQWITTLGY